ncbi:hypothetical protein GGR92_001614 [Spirosoma lacussanchae]|uniref:hypothetical protein n=1 Tax=Spirosoma lacussanchae TaxID=1884249 RepID=UPI001108EB77|nr:hypothetical protein [Spirosoma lacussanchae]
MIRHAILPALLAVLVTACCLFKPRPVPITTDAWFFANGTANVGFSTNDLLANADEDLYVCGTLFGNTSFCGQRQDAGAHFHGAIARFRPDRSCLWFNQFTVKNTSSSDDRCFLNKITLDQTGNVLVCGGFYGSLTYQTRPVFPYDSVFRSFVAKLDKNGSLIWAKEFRRTASLMLTQLLALPTGNFVALGQNKKRDGSNSGADDTYLLAFNANGTMLWQKQIDTELFDNPDDLKLSRHNTFYSLTVGGQRFTDRNVVLIKEWDFSGNEVWSFEQVTGFLQPKGYLAVDQQDNLWFGTSFTTERVPFIFGRDTLRSSRKDDVYLTRFRNQTPDYSTVLSGNDTDYLTGLFDETDGTMALTLNHGPNLTAFGKTYTVSTPYGFTRLLFNPQKPTESSASSYGVSFDSPVFPRNSQIKARAVRNGNEYMAGLLSGTLRVGTDTLSTKAVWGGFVIANRRKK